MLLIRVGRSSPGLITGIEIWEGSQIDEFSLRTFVSSNSKITETPVWVPARETLDKMFKSSLFGACQETCGANC